VRFIKTSGKRGVVIRETSYARKEDRATGEESRNTEESENE
jgi:hypothetical protein